MTLISFTRDKVKPQILIIWFTNKYGFVDYEVMYDRSQGEVVR